MTSATTDALLRAAEAAIDNAAKGIHEDHAAFEAPASEPAPSFEEEHEGITTLSEVLTGYGFVFDMPSGTFDPPCQPYPEGTWTDPEDVAEIPSLEDYNHYAIDFPTEAKFFWALHNGWKVKFDGPPGSGKTESARFAAAVLRCPYYRQNFYDGIDPDIVIGYPSLEDGDKGVVTGYIMGKLPRKLLRGGITLLDEPWKAPPTLWSAFAPLLERNGKLVLLGKGKDDLVTPHPTARIVLADNAKGLGDNADKYASAQIQDSSIINRIECHIEKGYMEFSKETKLAEALVPGHRTDDYRLMIQLTNQLRQAFEKGELGFTCSMRQLVPMMQTAKHYAWGGAWDLHFRSSLPDEDKGLFDRLYHKVYGENWS